MAVVHRALWERSDQELDTLNYGDVLELMSLDELLDDVDYALTALEPTEDEDTIVHSGLMRVVRTLDSLINLRNEARERIKRKAIIDAREELQRMAVDRLGTSEFDAVATYAELETYDKSLVTVKGSFKAKDGRHTFVQITQPK